MIFVKPKRFELTPHERIQASFHFQITSINKNTKHENTYMILRRSKRLNFTKMNLLAPLRIQPKTKKSWIHSHYSSPKVLTFFMNTNIKNQHSSSTNPNTWTQAISTNFINFKGFCLKMTKESIMPHTLKSSKPLLIFIICNHCHLKKGALYTQKMTINKNFHPHSIFFHHVKIGIGSFDDNQTLVIMKIFPSTNKASSTNFR